MALNKMLKTLAATSLLIAGSAYAQEPIAGAGIKAIAMPNVGGVSQSMLNAAGKDAKKLAAPERQLRADPPRTGNPDQYR